jgi:hypothetical protein
MTNALLKQKADRVTAKCLACAAGCAELERIDTVPSILSRESDVLMTLTQDLTRSVDAKWIRLETALTLMETILDLQEQAIAERKRQLERHRSQ